MASYNIVLNLGGNASTKIEKLADDLRRANTQAEKLKNTLNSMPKVGGRFGGGGGQDRYSFTSNGEANLFGMASMSTNISTSGGLNTTFKLLGRLNAVVGGATAIISAGIKAFKVGAGVTYQKYTLGAKGINYLAGVLTSSEMGEGIRLLQRRQQARLGFGAGYAQAQERADLLAASFGLDPSNVIASMNVLSGMPIGKTGQRISLGLAERLTQAGGLMAQQSGVPFERVMTNLQQMMSQTVPTIRDIREMLNAAPILSKYALQEMEKRGISGVSSMDWLKNQANIMTVLERFMSENPAIATMQARGIASRSKTQFYATLAENPAWLNIATQYEGLMEAAAKGLSSLLTAFSNSREMNTSVERLKAVFEDLPAILDKVSEKLDEWIRDYGQVLGINVKDYERTATIRAENNLMLSEDLRKRVPELRNAYKGLGLVAPKNDEELVQDALRRVKRFSDSTLFRSLPSKGLEAHFLRENKNLFLDNPTAFYKAQNKFMADAALSSGAFVSDYKITGRSGVIIRWDDIHNALKKSAPKIDTSVFPPTGIPTTGDDISGYGRDRKALIINFNDAIVKWDSVIESTQPGDVVNEVADNIEGMTSRALQIALLGASSRMTTNW